MRIGSFNNSLHSQKNVAFGYKYRLDFPNENDANKAKNNLEEKFDSYLKEQSATAPKIQYRTQVEANSVYVFTGDDVKYYDNLFKSQVVRNEEHDLKFMTTLFQNIQLDGAFRLKESDSVQYLYLFVDGNTQLGIKPQQVVLCEEPPVY